MEFWWFLPIQEHKNPEKLVRTEICRGIHFWHLFPILKSILAPSSAFVATQSEISKIDQIWKCYIDQESEMQLKTNGVFGTYPNTRYCVTFFDFEKHQKSYLFCNLTFFFRKTRLLKSWCEILFKIQNKCQKWIPWWIPLLDPTFQDLFPPKSEVGRENYFGIFQMCIFFYSPELLQ